MVQPLDITAYPWDNGRVVHGVGGLFLFSARAPLLSQKAKKTCGEHFWPLYP
jgi:hypothetical protein